MANGQQFFFAQSKDYRFVINLDQIRYIYVDDDALTVRFEAGNQVQVTGAAARDLWQALTARGMTAPTGTDPFKSQSPK